MLSFGEEKVFAVGLDSFKMEEQEYIKFFTRVDVSEENAIHLVENEKKGVVPLSYTEEVSESVSSEVIFFEGEKSIRYAFSDNSVVIESIETLESKISNEGLPLLNDNGTPYNTNLLKSVTINSVSSGTGYRNYKVKVKRSIGPITVSYNVDFTNVPGGYDYISRTYNSSQNSYFGGSFQQTYFGTYRKKETNSYYAVALYKGIARSPYRENTIKSELWVGKDTYREKDSGWGG